MVMNLLLNLITFLNKEDNLDISIKNAEMQPINKGLTMKVYPKLYCIFIMYTI